MIAKEKVEKLVKEMIDKEGLFLVEVSISPSNQISVFVDGNKGVSIDQCVAISKHIEQNLDREVEDYDLEVSSAGLGQPLKVTPQYLKNIGREIELVLKDGKKMKGILIFADENGVEVEIEKNVLLEGKKRKQLVKENLTLKYTDIKTTKVVVSFR